jgi:hypothetical protein
VLYFQLRSSVAKYLNFIKCFTTFPFSSLICIAVILSFIHQWLYSPLLGPGLFFSYVIFFTQTVELLGRVISPSQGRYVHAGQHKHRINTHTNIHASSGIRTHDRSLGTSGNSSCLRARGHCDRCSGSLLTLFLSHGMHHFIICSGPNWSS